MSNFQLSPNHPYGSSPEPHNIISCAGKLSVLIVGNLPLVTQRERIAGSSPLHLLRKINLCCAGQADCKTPQIWRADSPVIEMFQANGKILMS